MLYLNMVKSLKRDSNGSALLLWVGSGSGERKKMGTHSSRLDSHYNREGISRSRGGLRTPVDVKQILNVEPQTRFTSPGLFFQLSPGGGDPVKYGKPRVLPPFTLTQRLAPVVRNPDNFIHWISHYPALSTYSVWGFWRDFCKGQWFIDSHIILPSYCIRFIWLNQVFPTYFIYWTAAYPVDSATHPLSNCGLTYICLKSRSSES